jgi:TonB-dependent starch-binding outer membrane protein SusC
MKRIMKSKSVKKLLIMVLFLLATVSYLSAQGPVKVSGRITDDLKEPMLG